MNIVHVFVLLEWERYNEGFEKGFMWRTSFLLHHETKRG